MKFTLWPFSLEIREEGSLLAIIIATGLTVLTLCLTYAHAVGAEVDKVALSKGYTQEARPGSTGTLWIKPEEARK